jgi:RHS repeat-associated protein
VDALGNSTSFGYDTADRLASVTDALGRTTLMEYSERGLLTRIINPDGSSKQLTYTVYGDLASETNELGNTWSYTYDVFRRPTSVTDPLGNTWVREYHPDAFDSPALVVTAPSGRSNTFGYDLGWRLVSKVIGAGTPEASTTALAYDKANNVVAITDALGKVTKCTYDTRNRRISATDPLGNVSKWSYDAGNRVVSETRPDGGVSRNVYDSMNRLIETTDPKGQKTSMGYDAGGNLTRLTDAKGNTYTYGVDLLNRRTSLGYPGGSVESYEYDAVGNGVRYTTRAGQVRTSTYDIRNREVDTRWSDSTPSIHRSFDLAGRIISEDNALARLSYGYDSANQLLSERTSVTGQSVRTVSYMYDADGRRLSTTYPGGSVVSASYTMRGDVGAVVLDGTPVAQYEYNLAGSLTAKTLENGIRSNFTYDAAQRLTALEHRNGGDLLIAFGYILDKVGNRKTKAQSGINPLTENYSYDAVDQLTQARYGSARTVSYQYDPVGNRQTVTDKGKSEVYTVNVDNLYTSVGGQVTTGDANSNLTAAKGAVYVYDAQNRLVSATVGGNVTRFGYDPRNRVVKRTVNGVEKYLSYSGWRLIEERDGSGALVQMYVHGAALDELLMKTDQGGIVYYHADGLGSTVALTSTTGALVESYNYDAFGSVTVRNAQGLIMTGSTVGNWFLFTGREWLQEAGVYDYRNRVYSAQLGSFLQTDPMSFAGGDINIYRYCGNRVLSWIDPLGLAATICIKRTARDSTTVVSVFEDGKLLGSYIGNSVNGKWGSPDYRSGTQGPKDGTYSLLPRTDAESGYNQDGSPKSRYPNGTPAITGDGQNTGYPNSTYKNPVFFHLGGCEGASTACQTSVNESDIKSITNVMNNNINRGGTTVTLTTVPTGVTPALPTKPLGNIPLR